MSIAFSKLKYYRKQNGLTQEEVADQLGVSRQAVAKWERGESLPDISSCIALAKLYGTTVDLLVRNLGEEEQTGDGKYIFGISRLNDKGQITLPAGCRRVFGLNTGDTILILGDKDRGIALVKIEQNNTDFTDSAVTNKEENE
ncbi:MAG: helix-turn-helix domain-containing protein [Clostridia bacterium]|nr:helix-turn-helix domain-containing protein [Clostridia bacterium]MCR4906067.1 helix-turn-helix domain-containing protein [Clostridiales bacterium]